MDSTTEAMVQDIMEEDMDEEMEVGTTEVSLENFLARPTLIFNTQLTYLIITRPWKLQRWLLQQLSSGT